MSGRFQEMQRRQRQLDRKRRLLEKKEKRKLLRELRREEKREPHFGQVAVTDDPTEGMKEAAE
jgi:hypothetical protein